MVILNESLTANSKHFYFDYKNGKYGFNTSSSRGADTFIPFISNGDYPENWYLCYVPNLINSMSYSLPFQQNIEICVKGFNKLKMNCPGAGSTVVNIGVYSDVNRTKLLGTINYQSPIEIDVSNADYIYLYTVSCGSTTNYVSMYVIE